MLDLRQIKTKSPNTGACKSLPHLPGREEHRAGALGPGLLQSQHATRVVELVEAVRRPITAVVDEQLAERDACCCPQPMAIRNMQP